MTVNIYMKPLEKINYHKSLFEDWYIGLYLTINNVHYIKDNKQDYTFYDKSRQILTSVNKKQFYFLVKED